MYRVEFRFTGDGLWRTGNLPVTLQAAQTMASTEERMRAAHQVRIVPTEMSQRLLDLKV